MDSKQRIHHKHDKSVTLTIVEERKAQGTSPREGDKRGMSSWDWILGQTGKRQQMAGSGQSPADRVVLILQIWMWTLWLCRKAAIIFEQYKQDGLGTIDHHVCNLLSNGSDTDCSQWKEGEEANAKYH